MNFKPTNIKGAGDFGPEQQILRNRVVDTLRRNFEAYGYLPLETAMVNYLELLTYKYSDDAEIVREIYKIRDQGDRDLGLRFDLTVPFAKYIAMNRNMKLPFKRYEIGKVWRNGPVKSGRCREFYQCDVDAVGIAGPHIEAEQIAMAVKCYLELGIEPVVKYNSRKILKSVIIEAGAEEKYLDAVIAVVDRMVKVSREEMLADLSKYIDTANAERLLDRLNHPAALRAAPLQGGELQQFEQELQALGIDKYCEYAPWLARGLNVYTGMVWEVFDKAGRISSSLGGGGRFDKIIGEFIDNGQQYPAVGISFGMEPIIAVLTHQTPALTTPSSPSGLPPLHKGGELLRSLVDLMLIPLGTESWCQKYADTLRAKGKKVLVYLGGKSLAKAFEYAAANGIKSCAVIGEDEVRGKAIVIKEVAK